MRRTRRLTALKLFSSHSKFYLYIIVTIRFFPGYDKSTMSSGLYALSIARRIFSPTNTLHSCYHRLSTIPIIWSSSFPSFSSSPSVVSIFAGESLLPNILGRANAVGTYRSFSTATVKSDVAQTIHAYVQSGDTPLQCYQRLVKEQLLVHDTFQQQTMIQLNKVFLQIHENRKGITNPSSSSSSSTTASSASYRSNNGGLMSSLFGSFSTSSFRSSSSSSSSSSSLFSMVSSSNPRGLYIWGGTGSGKTMLMEIFYACSTLPLKKRVHFHTFMLDVHNRLHQARTKGSRGDLLNVVANELANESTLLCFDEFQVTDIGDAMILKRLFQVLFDKGLVMVATSNRAPEHLYANGLQRELFLPFIDLLKQTCDIHHVSSPTDYRLLASHLQGDKTWLVGSNGATEFHRIWQTMIQNTTVHETDLPVPQGRSIHIKKAANKIKCARFTFHELCGQPLYAADYEALAKAYGTLFIDNVPYLSMNERNELRRFITLIDVLYEHSVKVIVSAPTTPEVLFSIDGPASTNTSVPKTIGTKASPTSSSSSPERLQIGGTASMQYDEVFAWDRCVSRLLEMRSEEYLRAPWRPRSSSGTSTNSNSSNGSTHTT